MWLLLVSPALAAAPGHWHPTDLAPLSTRFAETSSKLQVVLEDRESTAKTLADALLEYEEALDLMGDRATVAERTRCDAMQEQFKDHRLELQTFAEHLVEDYDAAFRRAVAKAAGPGFADLQECPSKIATGPSLPGMPGASSPNPDCEGPDLNQTFAKAVDADPDLERDLAEVLSRNWPEIEIRSEPQPPVDGTRWLMVRDLVVAVAKDTLTGIENSDSLARLDLAQRAAETDAAGLVGLRDELAKIETKTSDSRAALGGPILEAADGVLAKKAPGTGWCANPRALGACTGDDAGADTLSTVAANKKVKKAAAANAAK
jgi:hypothetical protein